MSNNNEVGIQGEEPFGIGCFAQHGVSEVVLVVKNPPASAGDVRDTGSIPGSGRSPGGVHGNPLLYSCLGIPRTEEPGVTQSTGSQRV